MPPLLSRPATWRVVGPLWLIYASYYLGRVNHSIGQNGILAEYHWSKLEVGAIASTFTLCYGIGQFINGNLGDNLNPRRFLVVGLIGTACANFFFGFTHSLAWMVLLWGINGLFQSTGWPIMVKSLAAWYDRTERGRPTALWATCYQTGNVISWLLAGWCIGHFGWRSVYWTPVIILLSTAWFAYRYFPDIPDTDSKRYDHETPLMGRLWETASRVVKNPSLWLLAFAYTLHGFVRYSFLDWSITYFVEMHDGSISRSTLKSILFPTLGIFGVLVTGWLSNRIFKNKRTTLGSFLFMMLGLVIILFRAIPTSPWIFCAIGLGFVGFFLYGTDYILGVPATQDHSDPQSVAQSAGFIDGMMYMGAIFAGSGSGYLIDHLGWDITFGIWAGLAWLGALVLIPLWKEPLKNINLP